jgi:oligopeptide transport system substrate-binding protein
MNIRRAGVAAATLAVAGALVLSGCSSNSGGSDSKSSSSSGKADASAIITTNGNEPQNPLIPGNTTEVGGAKIVNNVFEGLVSYKADGSTEDEVAKSITSTDNQHWDIKLNDGWKFTNGEPVNADSFINAWNYTANSANAQGGSYFLDNIQGFSYDTPVTALPGLKKVSDTEFTVDLSSPLATWPVRLGYSAFFPLPQAAFKDMKAFGENPIGDGPYKLDGASAWTHNQQIKLIDNADYKGKRKPENGGLTIKFYTSQDTAYADAQSGDLDVLDAIPSSAFKTYESDFQGRSVNQAAAIFQSITIPSYLPHFGEDQEGKLRREAISLAINRPQITKVIFNNTRTPASDFTSPTIDGFSKDVKGNDVLKYNAKKAKDLWAQADAISKDTDTFTISYNADGGHQTWVDAVTNSLVNTLGIKAEGKSYADFASLLKDEEAQKMTGAFRSGWQADYPALDDFLTPLYQTGASSNYGQYSSKQVDDLFAQAAKASTAADANKLYQQAQTILFQDLPAIPLWYSNVNGVWSSSVSDVKFGWDSVPLYFQITKSSK